MGQNSGPHVGPKIPGQRLINKTAWGLGHQKTCVVGVGRSRAGLALLAYKKIAPLLVKGRERRETCKLPCCKGLGKSWNEHNACMELRESSRSLASYRIHSLAAPREWACHAPACIFKWASGVECKTCDELVRRTTQHAGVMRATDKVVLVTSSDVINKGTSNYV